MQVCLVVSGPGIFVATENIKLCACNIFKGKN